MNDDVNYVGSLIYSKIKPNANVFEGLKVCIYCKVSQSGINDSGNWYKNIDYQIPLDCLHGDSIKQCPACKTIYLLKDPTE